MKKQLALTTLLCLLFRASQLFSQSVYQDALDLARIMKNSANDKKVDSLWLRLANTTPILASKWGISEAALDTIRWPNEMDYLLVNKGKYPDALVIYQKQGSGEDSLLFSASIKYDFCVVRVRHLDNNNEQLSLIAPSGRVFATFLNPSFTDSSIVITNRMPGNFKFYERDISVWFETQDLIPQDFVNYKLPLRRDLNYIVPTLRFGDDLLVKNEGKLLLRVYKKGSQPAEGEDFPPAIPEKFVYIFLTDSVLVSLDGGDFTFEKTDTLESESEPFTLFPNLELDEKNRSVLAIKIPKMGYFGLSSSKNPKDFEFEIVPPKEEVTNRRLDLNPDKIFLRDSVSNVSLGSSCKNSFNQILLFDGARPISPINLKFPTRLDSIRFNKQTNSIQIGYTGFLHKDDTEFADYRKEFQMPGTSNLNLKMRLLRLDYSRAYSCDYGDAMYDSGLLDSLSKTIQFEVMEITDQKHRTLILTADELAKMPFEENKLYHIDLKRDVAEKTFKGFDFEDIAFLVARNPYNRTAFIWYPALCPTLVVFVKDSIAHIYYAPITVSRTVDVSIYQDTSLAVLLGTHAQLKAAELESSHIWGDISEKYKHNPYLAGYLKNNLSKTRFDPAPGMANAALSQGILAEQKRYFPWQNVLFGKENLKTEKKVAYDELARKYREPIPTASERLQVASEQFNSETQKIRGGLSTASLAAGLSDFIVERAQEELNLTFLNNLQERMLRDSEFMILFPKTVGMMGDFKIEQYRTLLDFAKSAFVQDLRDLSVNFPRLFSELPKYQALENDPKVYNLFLLYHIANKIYEDTPMEEVLLHLHSRLQERVGSLEDAIYLELGKKLVADSLSRQKLSGFVHHFGEEMKQLQAAKVQLTDPAFSRSDILSPTATLPTVADYSWRFDSTDIRQISDNLLGDPGYAYLLKHLEFSRFHEFFSQKPAESRTIRFGLEVASKLLSGEQNQKETAFIADLQERQNVLLRSKAEKLDPAVKGSQSADAFAPILQKYGDLSARRASLELALIAEKANHDPSDIHGRASLDYLLNVLRNPANYQLYDWEKLNTFGVSLLKFESENAEVQIKGTFEQDIYASWEKPENYLQGYRLLSLLGSNTLEMEEEMVRANQFLDEMAATMREHFPTISATRIPEAAVNFRQIYRIFLFDTLDTHAHSIPDYNALIQRTVSIVDTTATSAAGARVWPEIPYSAEIIEGYEAKLDTLYTKPDLLTGNPFLDYYDQVRPFQPDSKNLLEATEPFALEAEKARRAIAELRKTGEAYQVFLDSLKNDENDVRLRRLSKSLAQAKQFDGLISLTAVLLNAFSNKTAPEDLTVVARDTVLIHKKVFEKDRSEITYDSLWVIPRMKSNKQWLSKKQFNEMMEDSLQKRAFLGLIYQRLSVVENGLGFNSSSLALLATKLMNTVYEIDTTRAIMLYKKNQNIPLGFQDYYPFIRATVDMLNVVLETPIDSGGQALKNRYTELADLPGISNESLSLFENIFAENYGSAIRNVVQLLTIAWKPSVVSPGSRNLVKSKTLKKSERQLEAGRQGNEKVKMSILKYGLFMSEMVGAQSPAQVKAAISAVAVPPGNSSVKRNARVNVDVNGYLGIGFHNETLLADSLAASQRESRTFGLAAPVGITFSMGQWKIGKKEQSFSLFFPILDLGAVATYRINQTDTQSDLPKLSFGNLISPGAYLLWNVRKSPFTLGAGMQFGPQLRKITVDGKQISSSAWRYGVTATVDVPIFNLHTQQEKGGRH